MNNNPSNLFPNILNPVSQLSLRSKSPISLKNEYSYLNRYQYTDSLGQFSYELEHRLPKLNQRLKTLDDKQNAYERKSHKVKYSESKIKNLERDLDDMKRWMFLQERMNFNQGCHHQCIQPVMFANGAGMCKNCGDAPNRQKPETPISIKSERSHTQSRPLEKPSSQQIRQKRKGLIRKLRVAAWAVYFSIYLKNYSIKFTRNRYELFKDRYLLNQGAKVKEDSYKITKSIEVIDLISLILKSPISPERFSSLDIKDKSVEKKNRKEALIPSSGSDRFLKALSFIRLYIQKLEKVILREKFIEFYGEIIGIGTINQSFFMDDLVTPHEINIITFSEKKGFAQIGEDTERILVMIYILVKHVLYKILLKIRSKRVIEARLKEEEYSEYAEELESIFEFMELVARILYELVNTAYLEHVEEVGEVSNYHSLKNRFKVEPASVLSTPDCPKRLKDTVNYQELIVGLRDTERIKAQMEEEQHQDALGLLFEQIQDFSDRLRVKTKEVNKIIYQHIKQQTLQQKYLIFQGIEYEEQLKARSMKKAKKKTKQVPNIGSFNRESNTSLGNAQKASKKPRR